MEIILATPRDSVILDAIGDSQMVAPDLITVEVLSTLRRLVRQSLLSDSRAEQAVADLLDAPIHYFSALPLATVIWQLRHNLAAYDATYIALAATLDCALVSRDTRLTRAPNLPIRILVP